MTGALASAGMDGVVLVVETSQGVVVFDVETSQGDADDVQRGGEMLRMHHFFRIPALFFSHIVQEGCQSADDIINQPNTRSDTVRPCCDTDISVQQSPLITYRHEYSGLHPDHLNICSMQCGEAGWALVQPTRAAADSGGRAGGSQDAAVAGGD